MRSIVFDVAVSLDGYIAGPGDDVSMFPAEGDHVTDYLQRLASYETVLMGRRTYEFGYAYGLQPGKRAYPHMDHHLFSRTIDLPADAAVPAVRDDGASAVGRLKPSDGGDIYLCGGGMFAGFLADLGLIDRLVLKLAPVVIGDGVRLFDAISDRLDFHLRSSKKYDSGVVLLEYERAS